MFGLLVPQGQPDNRRGFQPPHRPHPTTRRRRQGGGNGDGHFTARLQHGPDYLNGILFIDRMKSATRTALAGKLKRLQREGKA